MDLISLLLFIGTLSLIISIVFFDLSRYKYHYFAVIIILGVALYTYGLVYNEPNPNYLDVVLKAFGNTSQILRGIFRTSDIMPRINNDLLFLMSAYAIHVLGFGYTYVLVFAIFFKNLNLRMRFHTQKLRANLLVLADDERVKYFLESFEKDRKNTQKLKFNLALSKSLQATKSVKTNYRFKPGVTTFDVNHQSLTHLLGRTTGSYLVSLLSEDDAVLALIDQLNRYFHQFPKSMLHVHIMYDDVSRLGVYESFNQHRQKVNFFSYEQLVSQAFIADYPLTRLLPYQYIKTDKATLSKVAIRYHMVGFGKMNQALYQHLYVTNQFPQQNSTFLPKDWFGKEPLHYEIYGENHQRPLVNKRGEEYATNKDYLPYPQLSSSTVFNEVKPSAKDVVQVLKSRLLKVVDFQIIIIAFGSDLDNLQVLQEVRDIVFKFRLQQHVRIFVQIQNQGYVQGSELFTHSFVEAFGQGVSIYSLKHITHPVFQIMAKNIYRLLHPKEHFSLLSFHEKNRYIYEVLSLRFRLNLMGCDLVLQDKGLSEKRYLDMYDPLQYRPENLDHLRARNDADINAYIPKKASLRSMLAQQEHLRQCAYQLMQGYAPMRKDDFAKNGELVDEINVEDARITTFDGLLTLHKILREKRGKTYAESDVFYPYFVTLDHVTEVLKGTPYKIIDKIDPTLDQTLEMQLDQIQSQIKD